MIESLLILIKFGRMDRGIIWTVQLIDQFPPLLLFLVELLMAYGDLICQLPQSVGLGMYGTSTIFLTVFFTGGTEGLFVTSVTEAADVVATPIMFGSLLFVYVFLYSASLSTDRRSLHQNVYCLFWIFHPHFPPIYYSLSGCSFTVIREQISFLKNVSYSPV